MDATLVGKLIGDPATTGAAVNAATIAHESPMHGVSALRVSCTLMRTGDLIARSGGPSVFQNMHAANQIHADTSVMVTIHTAADTAASWNKPHTMVSSNFMRENKTSVASFDMKTDATGCLNVGQLDTVFFRLSTVRENGEGGCRGLTVHDLVHADVPLASMFASASVSAEGQSANPEVFVNLASEVGPSPFSVRIRAMSDAPLGEVLNACEDDPLTRHAIGVRNTVQQEYLRNVNSLNFGSTGASVLKGFANIGRGGTDWSTHFKVDATEEWLQAALHAVYERSDRSVYPSRKDFDSFVVDNVKAMIVDKERLPDDTIAELTNTLARVCTFNIPGDAYASDIVPLLSGRVITEDMSYEQLSQLRDLTWPETEVVGADMAKAGDCEDEAKNVRQTVYGIQTSLAAMRTDVTRSMVLLSNQYDCSVMFCAAAAASLGPEAVANVDRTFTHVSATQEAREAFVRRLESSPHELTAQAFVSGNVSGHAFPVLYAVDTVHHCAVDCDKNTGAMCLRTHDDHIAHLKTSLSIMSRNEMQTDAQRLLHASISSYENARPTFVRGLHWGNSPNCSVAICEATGASAPMIREGDRATAANAKFRDMYRGTAIALIKNGGHKQDVVQAACNIFSAELPMTATKNPSFSMQERYIRHQTDFALEAAVAHGRHECIAGCMTNGEFTAGISLYDMLNNKDRTFVAVDSPAFFLATKAINSKIDPVASLPPFVLALPALPKPPLPACLQEFQTRLNAENRTSTGMTTWASFPRDAFDGAELSASAKLGLELINACAAKVNFVVRPSLGKYFHEVTMQLASTAHNTACIAEFTKVHNQQKQQHQQHRRLHHATAAASIQQQQQTVAAPPPPSPPPSPPLLAFDHSKSVKETPATR